MAKGIVLLLLALLAFLISWYCLLWVFSSGSLAVIECNGSYSLFHEYMRCRWPSIANALWLITGLASLLLLFFGIKALKNRARRVEPN